MRSTDPSRTRWVQACIFGAALAAAQASQATLIDRGGGLIYDTVLNVTWLQDTNYAETSGAVTSGPDGLMTWSEAMSWASSLTYYDSVRGVELTGWHLPDVSPVNGVSWHFATGTAGDTDDSYNISAPGTIYAGTTASQLAYMYYNNLDNTARCPPVGGFAACLDPSAPRVAPLNYGPFINPQTQYWTDSNEDLPFADALILEFDTTQYGAQSAANAAVARAAWVVRDGDVAAVPEPSTWLMLAAGLGLVGLHRIRRARG